MEATHEEAIRPSSPAEAQEWIVTQLAWEIRLAELRADFADGQGLVRYPAASWGQPAA